jgi:hypothetical protein
LIDLIEPLSGGLLKRIHLGLLYLFLFFEKTQSLAVRLMLRVGTIASFHRDFSVTGKACQPHCLSGREQVVRSVVRETKKSRFDRGTTWLRPSDER